jgi:hypothetical protein
LTVADPTGNLVPTADGAENVGTSAKNWGEVRGKKLFRANVEIDPANYDPAGAAASVSGDLSGHESATGAAVHGLGDSAVRNVGTVAGTVAAGDDSRFGGGAYEAGTGLSLEGNRFFLANTTATAGTYTNPGMTVDAQGRITSIASGTPSGGIAAESPTVDGDLLMWVGTDASRVTGASFPASSLVTSGAISAAVSAHNLSTGAHSGTFDAYGAATGAVVTHNAATGAHLGLLHSPATAGTGLSLTGQNFALANTTVTAGTYTLAGITVDAGGRITRAINGTVIGKQPYHGIEAAGALSFDNSSKVFTIASGTNTYWFDGVQYTTAAAITVGIDSFYTIATDTLYYIYFADATGALTVSTGVWNLKTTVPVATVFWNGSAGALSKETHNYTRPIDWHINAHSMIGARISAADFAMTAPSVASPSTVAVAGGSVWDEDLISTHSPSTNCRVWFQTGASTYRWIDANAAYGSSVRFVNSANAYALTDVGANAYINVWVYATPDIARPIYTFIETKATAAYNTVALARAVNPPNLANFGLVAEMKLLYRCIFKGDDSFVEATDYRSSASVPLGGTSAPTASAVSFIPSGTISGVTVQAAIEELDAERVYTAGTGLALTGFNFALANTSATAGTYTLATVTVDAQGRITHAVSGTSTGMDIDGLTADTDPDDADTAPIYSADNTANRKVTLANLKTYFGGTSGGADFLVNQVFS